MLRLPVGGIAVDDPGRRGTGLRALIADIAPDSALHHALADTFGASFWSQHADGCVVGVQDSTAQDCHLNSVDHRLGDFPRHAAGDWSARRWRLDHLLAATAGLLWACDLDDLDLCRDHLEDLAHVLADETQIAAAIRARAARIELVVLARCIRRDTRLAR